MTGQRPTCAVCDHDAGAPTAPLRRPASRNGKYLCNAHAAQSAYHEQVRGRPEQRQAPAQLADEQLEAHLRRHPPQQRSARTAPPQTTAPAGRVPQGDAAQVLPRTPRSHQPNQGTGDPRGYAPAQGTERALAPTQGTRARLPRHVPSPSHPPAAPRAPQAPPPPPADRAPQQALETQPPTPDIVDAPPQVPPPADGGPVVG